MTNHKLQLPICFDAFHDLLLEFPAGHLADFELTGKGMGGGAGRIAEGVGHPECLGERHVTAVKDGMGGG